MTKTIVAHLFVGVAVGLTSVAAAQSKPAADLIISDAKIWTGDASKPTAESVAVLGDRIVAVGSNSEVDAWRDSNTKVIDEAHVKAE